MIADILQFRCFIHHINKDLLHEIHIQLKKYFDIQDATIYHTNKEPEKVRNLACKLHSCSGQHTVYYVKNEVA